MQPDGKAGEEILNIKMNATGQFGKRRVLVFVIALAAIIAAIAVVLLIGGIKKMGPPQLTSNMDFSNEPYVYVPQYDISMAFCKDIDASFKCIPQEKSIYEKSENVWILITITDLKSIKEGSKYFAKYTEERELYSPANILIPSASGVVLDEQREMPFESYFTVYLKNQLITSSSDATGNYTLKIKIKDKKSGLTT